MICALQKGAGFGHKKPVPDEVALLEVIQYNKNPKLFAADVKYRLRGDFLRHECSLFLKIQVYRVEHID